MKDYEITCDRCRRLFVVSAEKKDVERWKSTSAFIEECLDYLSEDDRELMLDGICGPCFDEIFPPSRPSPNI